MKWISIILFGFLILFGVFSSIKTNFKYVSEQEQYNSYISKQFSLKDGMQLSGVNLPPGYNKDINIYYLEPVSPSWSGPELISREELDKGTVFTIIQIRECTNCFEDQIQAVVHLEVNKKLAAVPIVIDLEQIKSLQYVSSINT